MALRRQTDRQTCSSQYLSVVRITLEVDPSAAVGVNVGDHVVNVGLGQVVTELLQDPPDKQTSDRPDSREKSTQFHAGF